MTKLGFTCVIGGYCSDHRDLCLCGRKNCEMCITMKCSRCKVNPTISALNCDGILQGSKGPVLQSRAWMAVQQNGKRHLWDECCIQCIKDTNDCLMKNYGCTERVCTIEPSVCRNCKGRCSICNNRSAKDICSVCSSRVCELNLEGKPSCKPPVAVVKVGDALKAICRKCIQIKCSTEGCGEREGSIQSGFCNKCICRTCNKPSINKCASICKECLIKADFC